eukprot:5917143-Amphidinium_carterae.1
MELVFPLLVNVLGNLDDVAVKLGVDVEERMHKSCARDSMRNTRNELELIDENVVEVKVDVEVENEDVGKLKLILVGVLEEVDELELVERSVVEVNVAGVVDVEVDVEDVDELEFVLPLLVHVLGIFDDVAVKPGVD